MRDWDIKPITSGRFFRLTHFANQALAALLLGHDRYGMFVESRTIAKNRDGAELTLHAA